MSVEKEALSEKEYDSILSAAMRKSEEAANIIKFLRWTGMHVSVLAEPLKHNLRTEWETETNPDTGITKEVQYIVWDRPKKKGKDAKTDIRVHADLNIDIDGFIEILRRRRSANKKRRISRQYFYNVCKDVGERAGYSALSPMSFRHTFGVWLAT